MIRFEDTSKRYSLGHQSIREALAELPQRLRLAAKRRNPCQAHLSEGRFLWALRHITFDVIRGTALGIIGPNGAGKSTLLKLLAGITRPTEGKVEVRGRVASLIELGAGFHPDLTGRENVYLNGSILGLTRREIDRKLESIIDFAELTPFIDMPVKRYSSGMYARLGFSVAVHIDPEVLVLDEVLAVGDINFQSKCYKKIVQLLSGGATAIMVSHNPYTIRDYCQRAVFLNGGQIQAYGDPNDVVRDYQAFVGSAGQEIAAPTVTCDEEPGLKLRVLGPKVESSNGMVSVSSGSPLQFIIEYDVPTPIAKPVFGIDMRAVAGQVNASYATDFDRVKLGLISGKGTITLSFESFDFPVGTYQIDVLLSEGRQENHIRWKPALACVVVTQNDRARGMFSLAHRWQISDEKLDASVA
jgi:homopolymeric O-antigen transport system ATP-binding protein